MCQTIGSPVYPIDFQADNGNCIFMNRDAGLPGLGKSTRSFEVNWRWLGISSQILFNP
jgi:hypothetical protein